METLKEVDHRAASGSEDEFPSQEDAVEEQTSERRLVDALLDISEEDFMRELEPYEYHCYSGWEEAVHGWARVAPLSCILLPQKRNRKPKHKEADNPMPSAVDPTDSSTSIAEHRCESYVAPHNGLKKSIPLSQHIGSWGNTAEVALQKDASEWPVLSAVQKTVANLILKEKMEEEGAHLPSKYLENRPAKPQKPRHRPNNTVLPIKNFTFLPPIKSPHLNPQKASGQFCSGKKAPEGETIEESCFMFDKKSGTRVDPNANPELPIYSAALDSKYRTCPYNPHLFSALSVSIPKRYQVAMSSKPDTVHRTRYSVGKSLTQTLHSSTAAGAQSHMHPSKTVCM
ncbi:uncharacterized protein C16orf46 homolog [Epinephelus fuscoguttatus]|uniref:uncharacterized protein C16orf46 homolog n=1 Tax=Epinephelus fuscoguttatus TaxID=293821 RepID=UPI0020D16C34|nr:uncharacterized protein C16orf46 homolog [Epinephelus fuscoguttatus]